MFFFVNCVKGFGV